MMEEGNFDYEDESQLLSEHHYFNEYDEMDYDALLEAVQKDPQLLTQLQSLYSDVQPMEFTAQEQTLASVFQYCAIPSVQSIMDSMFWLLLACIICNFIGRFVKQSPRLMHGMFSLAGLLVLWKFFEWNTAILAAYAVLSWALISLGSSHCGIFATIFTVMYVIVCELFVEPEKWHNIRGAQIVMSMKAISLAFDTDKGNTNINPVTLEEFFSYILNPGTVIFGPWMSYNEYLNSTLCWKKWFDLRMLLAALWFTFLSIISVLYSGCFITYILPSQTDYRWLAAYRDAQSFRFSHYFVCFTSQLTALLAGLSKYDQLGYFTEPITVTKPHNIEIPRSLVEVVVSWNLPMHSWLKTYVFKITQPIYGNLFAILITYVASSLLHGLNFQLAAVLLSLGFYSYIEHTFRKHLARTLNACIEARDCKSKCTHFYRSHTLLARFFNLLFGLLSLYHLAYLGVMFDTSDQRAHSEGYSMEHTLSKWAHLGFSSHIVAFSTYCLYLLIKP